MQEGNTDTSNSNSGSQSLKYDPFAPENTGLPVIVTGSDGKRIGNVWSPWQNGLGAALNSVSKGESTNIYFDPTANNFVNYPVSKMSFSDGKISLNVAPEVASSSWYKEIFKSELFKGAAAAYAKDPTGKTELELTNADGSKEKKSINDILQGFADSLAENSEKYKDYVDTRNDVSRLTGGALYLTDEDIDIMGSYQGFSKDNFSDTDAFLLPESLQEFFKDYASFNAETGAISARDFYEEFFNLNKELPDSAEGILETFGGGKLDGIESEVLQQEGESNKDYAIDLVRVKTSQEMIDIVQQATFNKDNLSAEERAHLATEYVKCYALYKAMTKDTPNTDSWTGFNMAVQGLSVALQDGIVTTVESLVHTWSNFVHAVVDGGVKVAAAINTPFSWFNELISNLATGGWDEMTQNTRAMYEHFDEWYTQNSGQGSIPGEMKENIKELGEVISNREDLAAQLFAGKEYDLAMSYANTEAMLRIGRIGGLILTQIVATNPVGQAIGGIANVAVANALSYATTGYSFAALTNMASIFAAFATTANTALQAAQYMKVLNTIRVVGGTIGFAANVYAQGVVDTFVENPALTDALLYGESDESVTEFQNELRMNILWNTVGEFAPGFVKRVAGGTRKGLSKATTWLTQNTTIGAFSQASLRKAMNFLTLRGRKGYEALAEFMTDKFPLTKQGEYTVEGGVEGPSVGKLTPAKYWQDLRKKIIAVQEDIEKLKILGGDGVMDNAKAIDDLIQQRIDLEELLGSSKKYYITQARQKIFKGAGVDIEQAEIGTGNAELAQFSRKLGQANLPGTYSKETGNYINDLFNRQRLLNKQAFLEDNGKSLSKVEQKGLDILLKRISDYEASLPSDFAESYKTAVKNYMEVNYRFYYKLNNYLASDAGGNLLSRDVLNDMRANSQFGEGGAMWMPMGAVDGFKSAQDFQNFLNDPLRLIRTDEIPSGVKSYSRKTFSSDVVYFDPNYMRDIYVNGFARMTNGVDKFDGLKKLGSATAVPTDANGRILKTSKEVSEAKDALYKDLEKTFESSFRENLQSLGPRTVETLTGKAKDYYRAVKVRAQRTVNEILGLNHAGLKTYASTLNSAEIEQISKVYSLPAYSRKITSIEELNALYNSLNKKQKEIVKKIIPNFEETSVASRKSSEFFDEIPSTAEQKSMLDVSPESAPSPKYSSLKDYYAKEKGREVDFVYMTPDEYLEALLARNGGISSYQTVEDIIARSRETTPNHRGWKDYAEDMRTGNFNPELSEGGKFPPPYLAYRASGGLEQEGIHRALAAKSLGVTEMPVVVETPVKNKPAAAIALLEGKARVEYSGTSGVVAAEKSAIDNWNYAVTNNNLDVLLSRQYVMGDNTILRSNFFKGMVGEARAAELEADEALALRNAQAEVETAEEGIKAGKAVEPDLKKIKAQKARDFKKVVRGTLTEAVDGTVAALMDNPYLEQLIKEYEKMGVSSDVAKEYIILQWLYDNSGKGGVLQDIAFRYYNAPSKVSEIKASTDAAKSYSKKFRDAAESIIESKLNRVVKKINEEGVEGLIDLEATSARVDKYFKDITDLWGSKQIVEVWDRENARYAYYQVDKSTYNLVTNYPTFKKANGFAKTMARINSIARLGQIILRGASLVTQGFKDTFNAVVLGGWDELLLDNPVMYKKIAEYIGPEVVEAFRKEMTPSAWKDFLAMAEWQGLTVEEAIAKSELNNELLETKISGGPGTSASYFSYRNLYDSTDKSAVGAMAEIEASKDTWKGSTKAKWQEAYNKARVAWYGEARAGEQGLASRVYDAVNILHNARETFLREQVYRQNFMDALGAGKSLAQARNYAQYFMENATTNFSRGFAWGDNIIRSIPYFGAMINGASSMIRLLEVDPLGIMTRFTMDLVVPTIGLTVMSLQDPRNAEVYKNIPEYEKEGNIHWVVDGQVYTIPLPEELAKFILPIRHAVEKIADANGNAWHELLLNDLLNMPTISLNAVMMLDDKKISGDPSVMDRISALGMDLFNSLAPNAARTMYIAMTGKDPYTGENYGRMKWYQDENGEYQLMAVSEYGSMNDLADLFKSWGINNVSAIMAEGLFSSFFGAGSLDIFEGLRDLAVSIQQGSPDVTALLAPSMERAGNVLTGTTRTDEKQAQIAWYALYNEVKEKKDELLAPDGKLAKYAQDIDMAKDQATLDKKTELYDSEVNNWHNYVLDKVKTYNSMYGGFFTRSKFASTISMMTANLSIDRVRNSDNYYNARALAIETMYDAGFTSPSDTSVFGYVYRDPNTGRVAIKYTDPLIVSLSENLFWYQGDEAVQMLKDTIELSGLKDRYNEVVYPAYKEYLDANNYTAANNLAASWDVELMKAIKPIIDEYQVDNLLNKSIVVDLLDNYILVPSTTEAMGRGKYYSSKTGLNKRRGFAQSYAKKIYEAMKKENK